MKVKLVHILMNNENPQLCTGCDGTGKGFNSYDKRECDICGGTGLHRVAQTAVYNILKYLDREYSSLNITQKELEAAVKGAAQ